MALIKTRPDVRLLLPRPLLAGRPAEFIVELECSKPVPVESVSLRLLGDVLWFISDQYGRHRSKSRFLDHAVPLVGEQTELGVGMHQLRAQVLLGDQLPGTWTGDRLWVEYAVEVHVDIPWWPDKRATFVVRIADARRTVVDEVPTVYVSHAGGPPGKGPYLELSLGQHSVPPGGVLRASAALGNVARNNYRRLEVDIIAQESYPNVLGGPIVHEHAVARWTVSLDGRTGELQPIPFSVAVPTGLTPAFDLHGCKLQWFVEVNADVAWGVDPKLRVPIVVQPAAIVDTGEVAAPLAVGSDRLRLIWSKVGKDLGLEFDRDRLFGARADVSIEILRDSDQGQTRVLGRLEYPNLGLGLRPYRERRSLLGALESGLATRDDEQTRVIDTQLGARIAKSGYELLAADDGHLSFAFQHAGLELAPLADFASWLVDLAERVAGVPNEVPMPAAMRVHADVWARAAKLLRGRLRMAEPSIEIERDGLKLCLECIYDEDGRLDATQLSLVPGLAIPSRLQTTWSGDTPLPEVEIDLRDLAANASWTESRRILIQVEAERVRVHLPAPLPDPALELQRIEALLDLGRQLRGEQGPYR